MTKVTTIGHNEHRFISAKVEQALKTLETELGVKFKTQGGMIGAGSGMIKLGVEVIDTGAGMSGKQTEFARWAVRYNLKPEWFGKTFFSQGVQYRITGVSPSRPTYPIDAERVHDRRSFKMGADTVRRGMEVEVAMGRVPA